MVTPIETVWTEMKVAAAQFAVHGERPTRAQAEATVSRLMSKSNVSPWPPETVIEFFASELLSMVDSALPAVPSRDGSYTRGRVTSSG